MKKYRKLSLRCMDTLPCFTVTFSEGDNFCDFLFAFLDKEALPEWGQILKKTICSQGSKLIPLRLDFHNEKGGRNVNGGVLSPESVSIHLKLPVLPLLFSPIGQEYLFL